MQNPALQPILTVWTSDPGFDMGHGRNFFFGPFGCTSQQVYALLWDPSILALCGKPPKVRAEGESIEDPDHTLLLYAHPTPESDVNAAQTVLAAGGHVIFNRPDPGVFKQVPALHDLGDPPKTVTSLCERWQLGPSTKRDYYYMAREPFYRYIAAPEQTLSYIGDNPDLVMLDHAAVFAGNPFAVLNHYVHLPLLDQLLLDLTTLLANAIRRLADGTPALQDDRISQDHAGLRRDFHAFGFAYQTVMEFARCLGKNPKLATDAAMIAMRAAQSLMRNDAELAKEELACAFENLGEQYKKLESTPAIFTDTLHGGGLLQDIGYFEFDWPQHTADMLRRHLRLTCEVNYRFNLDFAATSLHYLADRFPKLINELRTAVEDGRIEFVHGSLNQAYPPFHSLESQLRQYDIGLSVFDRLIGRRPRILASQEFAFSAQTPAMLQQYGYDGAVLRVQNFSDAPTINETFIRWASPDGHSVQTIPSHGDKSEQRNDLTYANLHLKLYVAQQLGVRPSVFSCMGDATFYRPMREELARVCRYMPALGRFATWSECFTSTDDNTPAMKRFKMEDFTTDRLVMMDPNYPSSTTAGNFIEHGLRSMAASHLFVAAEFIETFTDASNSERSWCWEDLLNYQGHDTYIVPNYPSGGYMGGVNDPDSRLAGHARPTVAEYRGTWDDRTIRKITSGQLGQSEQAAEQSIHECLCKLAVPDANAPRWVIYNASAARNRVVRLPKASGFMLASGGHPIPVQEDGEDLLAHLDLPAWSVATVDTHKTLPPNVDHPVVVGECTLDNGKVHAEFDPSTGQLTQFLRCEDGASIVRPMSHRFILPGSGIEQRCYQVRVIHRGPIRGTLEFEIELRHDDEILAKLRSRVTLDANEVLLCFETEVLSSPLPPEMSSSKASSHLIDREFRGELKGDQWEHHLGVCFDVPDEKTAWYRSHFNVLEPSTQERVFSPNLMLACGDGVRTTFINHGNFIYLRQGTELRQLMLYENEPTRRFEYAVGLANEFPIIQARTAVQPVYVDRIAPQIQTNDLSTQDVLETSWVEIESSAIELLSCTRVDNGLRIRMANTMDKPVKTSLRFTGLVTEACRTNFLGESAMPLDCHAGHIAVEFASYEIVQIHVSSHTKDMP